MENEEVICHVGYPSKRKAKMEEQAQVKIHALPFTLIQTSANIAL